MESWAVAAALCSALLHTLWNAAVKVHAEPQRLMAAAMVAAGVWALPVLAFTGLPGWRAWPWLAASSVLNMLAVAALLRAYANGPFGTVYAMVRASAVLTVVPLAAALAGERLPWPAVFGVLLIVGALALLGASARNADGARPHETMTRRGWGYALAAGACTALYVVLDAQGARRAGLPGASGQASAQAAVVAALSYGAAMSVINALFMATLQRRHGAPWHWPLLRAPRAWGLAALSTLSYLLIVAVYTRAPIALAAALRDTSALWALLIGALFLGEKLTPLRLLALSLAAAGVPLLRLA